MWFRKLINYFFELKYELRQKYKYKKFKILAPLVASMAQSGEGTDLCLESGCLPMMVHFYSPVPDIPDLIKRDIFSKESELPGIDLKLDKQLDFLMEIGGIYGNECSWPDNSTSDPLQFFLQNGCFSFGCASSLHSIIRYFKPKKIIEIGSGYSSLVISAALKNNKSEGKPCEYSIIDPYPGNTIISGKLLNLSKLIKERVELTDISLFTHLEENDILFIDSGHTVKLGADVNFLILEVLPRLQAGVIIHFHDINLPYPPPEVYYTNSKFRVFWTEEFLLQAFLMFNTKFEILLAMNYIQSKYIDKFSEAFKFFDFEKNWANSGSFWIRKIA